MDEVVVTATRTKQTLRDVPANVTVLTREDIERSAAPTVDDFLRRIPGFTLLRQSSSRVGQFATQAASLRGLGGTSAGRTLILLDGVPLNDPFGGWVHWGRVPLETVERIEIVRGGVGGVWGNRALGGIINIITRKPEGRGITLSGQGGSQATADLQLSATSVAGPVRMALAGSYYDTEGFETVPEDQRGAVDERSAVEHGTLGAQLGYALSPEASLSFAGSLFTEDRHLGTPLQRGSVDIAHLRAGLDLDTPGGSDWRITAFSTLQSYEQAISSVLPDRSAETPSANQFDIPAAALGASVQWSRPVGGLHLLTAGTDVQLAEAQINEDVRFVSNQFTRRRRIDGEQLLDGVYVQDILTPDPRWQVVAGGRLDVWRSSDGARLERDLQTDDVVVDQSYPSHTEVSANPSLAVLYRATDRVAVRGSAYRAFRAPTLSELFQPFRAAGNIITEANPELDQEQLTGAEMGLDYATGTGFLGRLTAFSNDVEGFIANVTLEEAGATARPIEPCGLVPAGGVCRQKQNLGRLRSRGLEAEVELRPHPAWVISGSYLYSDAKVVEADRQPQLVGKQNLHAPHQVVLAVDVAAPALVDLSLVGRYVGKRFSDDLNLLPLDDFFVVNLLASRRLADHWRVWAGVENVLDTSYEVNRFPSGVVETGSPIALHLGIRVGS